MLSLSIRISAHCHCCHRHHQRSYFFRFRDIECIPQEWVGAVLSREMVQSWVYVYEMTQDQIFILVVTANNWVAMGGGLACYLCLSTSTEFRLD
jgi:hypothetical protein